MTLVVAQSAHVAALAHIHREGFSSNDQWSAASFEALIASRGVRGWIEHEGQGFVLARTAADEAEILTIAVVPSARRTGLATGLLDAAEAWACSSGAKTMFLEVAADNEAAIALYIGRGFREVGRRHRYYFDGRGAIVLRKHFMLCGMSAG